MNRIYRLVWNRALRVLQVASELSVNRGGGTAGSSTLVRHRLRPLAQAVALAMLVGGTFQVQAAAATCKTVDNVDYTQCATDGGNGADANATASAAGGSDTMVAGTPARSGGSSGTAGQAGQGPNGGAGAQANGPDATGGGSDSGAGGGAATVVAGVTTDFGAGGGAGGNVGMVLDENSPTTVSENTIGGNGGNGGAGGNAVSSSGAGGGGGSGLWINPTTRMSFTIANDAYVNGGAGGAVGSNGANDPSPALGGNGAGGNGVTFAAPSAAGTTLTNNGTISGGAGFGGVGGYGVLLSSDGSSLINNGEIEYGGDPTNTTDAAVYATGANVNITNNQGDLFGSVVSQGAGIHFENNGSIDGDSESAGSVLLRGASGNQVVLDTHSYIGGMLAIVGDDATLMLGSATDGNFSDADYGNTVRGPTVGQFNPAISTAQAYSGSLLKQGNGYWTLDDPNGYDNPTSSRYTLANGPEFGAVNAVDVTGGTLELQRELGHNASSDGTPATVINIGPEGTLRVSETGGTNVYNAANAMLHGAVNISQGGLLGFDLEDSSDNVPAMTFDGSVAGNGNISVGGGSGSSSTLEMTGDSSTFAGRVDVSDMTALALDSGATLGNADSVLHVGSTGANPSQGAFGGSGSFGGSVFVDNSYLVLAGGVLTPSFAGTFATLTIGGNLTLAAPKPAAGIFGNVTLVSIGDPTQSPSNDRVDVGGNLTLNGQLQVNDTRYSSAGGPASPDGTWTLFNYGGTYAGGGLIIDSGSLPAAVVLGNADARVVDVANGSGAGGHVDLIETGNSAPLAWWNGSASPLPVAGDAVATPTGGAGTWDATSVGWDASQSVDGSSGKASQWTDGNFAVFANDGGDVTLTGAHTVSGLQFLGNNYALVNDGGSTGSLALAPSYSDTSGPDGSGTLVRVGFSLTATIDVPLTDNGNSAGSLIKRDDGTLILGAENTYSGGTIIGAGTLQLGDGTTNHLGTLGGSIDGTRAANVEVMNGATLAFNNGADQILVGSISGDGSLSLQQSGRLTLTGNSGDFSGTAVLGSGTLVMQDGSVLGNAVSALNVNQGILGGNGTLGGNVTLTNGATLAPFFGTTATGPGDYNFRALHVGGNLSLDTSSTSVFALGASGVSDQVAVGGNLNLNGTLGAEFTQPPANGTWSLFTYGGSYSGDGVSVDTGTDTYALGNGDVWVHNVANVAGTPGGHVDLTLQANTVSDSTFLYWNGGAAGTGSSVLGGNGDWSDTSVWQPAQSVATGQVWNPAAFAEFTSSSDNSPYSVNVTGPQTVSGLQFQAGANVTLSGTGSLLLQPTDASTGSSSGAGTVVRVDQNTLAEVDLPLADVDAAHPGELLKTGVGQLTLGSADSTYSGGTALQGGTLFFTGLSTTLNSDNSIASGPLGTGALTADAHGQAVTLSTDGYIELANDIVLNSDLSITRASANNSTLTLDGVISGSGGLNIDGSYAPYGYAAGSIYLTNGGNDYSGGTVIGGKPNYAPYVYADATGALGSGDVLITAVSGPCGGGSASLDFEGDADATVASRAQRKITLQSTLDNSGNFSEANLYFEGGTAVNYVYTPNSGASAGDNIIDNQGGSIQFGDGSHAGTADITNQPMTGNIGNGGRESELDFYEQSNAENAVIHNAGNVYFNNDSTGGGTLGSDGVGAVIDNQVGGNLYVTQDFDHTDGSMPGVAIGALRGPGGHVWITQGQYLAVGSLNTDETYAGIISDYTPNQGCEGECFAGIGQNSGVPVLGDVDPSTLGGELIKAGSGMLTLSGHNTYTGGTTVIGGVLGVYEDDNVGSVNRTRPSSGQLALEDGTGVAFLADGGNFNRGISVSGDPTFSVAAGNTFTVNSLVIDGGTPPVAGDVEVIGGGLLYMTNIANSYSGDTVVRDNSTLSIADEAVLGAAGTGVTLGDADHVGTLQFINPTGTPLTSMRGFTLAAGGGILDTEGDAVSLTGVFNGSGSLTKIGAAALTMMGVNTFTGGTNVNAGALVLATGGALASTTNVGMGAQFTMQTGSTLTSSSGAAINGVVGAGGSMPATILVDGASVSSAQGDVFDVTHAMADITVANGASLTTGTHTLLHVSDSSSANFTVDHTALTGNISVAAGSTANVLLRNQAQLTGVIDPTNVAIDASSLWTIAGNSEISNFVLDGAAAFQPSASHYTLLVDGDMSGSGGSLTVNTELNAGGAVANQLTDRVLIAGNVTTTGTTAITVTPTGSGASTDSNGDFVANANEGISVVQVAGTSRANAFALSGPGYVAVGPWRYDLHAFAPGDSDAGQRQVIGSGNNFWDYRLATECIVSSGQTCTPDDGGKGRPAVVPQLPAYVAAPTAMLAFGLQITDTLHQRLGEVRNDQFSTPADSSGEVFVRVRGSGNTYHSDHAFSDFGYNFSEHSIAMQMGISKLSIDADAGSMRVGGAVTVGRTNVNPHAADGWSQIQFNNASLAGLVTWQGAKGWYADGVLSYDNYRGNISTAPHGDRVGRLIGNGWTASAETGYNMAMSGRMRLEPEAQITYQQVNIDNSTDTGGLHVQYGNIAQMVVRVGARLAWTLGDTRTAQHWTPYLKGNIYNSFGGRPRLTASSDALNVSDNFSSGSFGSIWELGAGATGTLARNMSLYGDVDYRGELGSSGMSGWTGNIGLRVEF